MITDLLSSVSSLLKLNVMVTLQLFHLTETMISQSPNHQKHVHHQGAALNAILCLLLAQISCPQVWLFPGAILNNDFFMTLNKGYSSVLRHLVVQTNITQTDSV